MKKPLILLLFISFQIVALAQNPIIPGYFADPSIKKFDDTYYLYATTDGYPPFGNQGQTLAWISKNLSDWTPQVLEGLPDKTIWAPAITKGKNGKYYLYTTNSVDYSGYVWEGNSPTGPFVLRNHLGGFDLEPFIDPVTGKTYVVSASKVIYEMDNDKTSSGYLTHILKSIQLKGDFFDFTEGPYLFYRNNFYYLMWAGGNCADNSYKVRYAYAKNIEGPYTDGPEPVIKTNETEGIIGPGHNSVIEVNGRYFLLYHREDNSRQASCNYRFTCVSEIGFDNVGGIRLLNYVNNWGKLFGYSNSYPNIALNKNVIANSSVGKYDALSAVDGRNDTRWTSKDVPGILTVDLGSVKKADGIEIDFEFPDKWQTYKVEYSTDNNNWQTLINHAEKAVMAYKNIIEKTPFEARYVRLTINNSEDRNASLWEFKVLGNQLNTIK